MQLAVETAVGNLRKCISHIAKPQQDSRRLQTGAAGTAVRAKCQNVKPQHLLSTLESESESELELKSSWLVMDAKLVDRQAGSAAPPPLPRCVIGPGHLRASAGGAREQGNALVLRLFCVRCAHGESLFADWLKRVETSRRARWQRHLRTSAQVRASHKTNGLEQATKLGLCKRESAGQACGQAVQAATRSF